MKNIRKISGVLLFLFIFAGCKNKDDAAGNTYEINDSSAYHNSAAADSIKAQQENKPTGSYSYYPKESEANKNQNEESVSKNKATQQKQELNSSGSPQEDKERGWSKNAQAGTTGATTGAKDEKK